VELVAALAARGRRVLVTGGRGERHLTARVAGRHANVTDLGGRTTFPQLADVLAGADAVIVGNTGPAHLAAAGGTPVVSLYAPTVPAVRWRPWRVPHELHHLPVACAGCRARECPVPGHPCIDDVGIDTVLASIERLAPAARPVAA
jgi:ADP-heptose:LPS heptosyltransferase